MEKRQPNQTAETSKFECTLAEPDHLSRKWKELDLVLLLKYHDEIDAVDHRDPLSRSSMIRRNAIPAAGRISIQTRMDQWR